ncbi:dihydrofolate reductase [Candidatus Saccharibacteria bacterium]|nr:dihydrofolate reductase [Candidatus Saccharibacteria bacterium]
MITLVAAYGNNREFGFGNDLPWGRSLPADLAHFKKVTTGRTLVMGRKTFQSLPRVLPDRQHIVVTSGEPLILHPRVQWAISLKQALQLAGDNACVIGGVQMFSELLANKVADELIITHVHGEFDADKFFPVFNENEYEKNQIGHINKDEHNAYACTLYRYMLKR